jgi:low temperature requirement protein LtrA
MPATQAAVRHPGAAARLARTPLRHIRISPPPLRTTDGHSPEPRHASWLELFFDLVFAGAVNQLAGTLQDHPDLITLARFAFFFVPVWWLWVQFSFYADRHESDDAAHRGPFIVAIVLCAGLAASASRAVSGDPVGFVVAFSAMRAVQLLLYARARKHLPATRRLYGRYLICFGLGGALWMSSLSVGGPLRFAFWTAALAADAVGGLGILSPKRHVPLNAWHLAERFQLFVLIVLGESVVRLISAATLRPWSVPLAVVLTAAVVTLATLWRFWIRSADHRALDGPRAIAWFAAANLPIVGGVAAASAGLHVAILAADGGTTIGIGPRAALYGGVSVCLLASAALPSGRLNPAARAARLATAAAAMGLVFMGAIVVPVYLVPALTLVLALGLAAESASAVQPAVQPARGDQRSGAQDEPQAAAVSRSSRPFPSHGRYARRCARPTWYPARSARSGPPRAHSR